MTILNFDASQVAPNTGVPDPIPSDWYNAIIDETEMKPTKDGLGSYLQVRYSVADGQYANRKVYARLNLRNNNPVAQEIAYGELSAICHAIGLMQVQDSSQLHNIPVKIKVKLKPADGQYDASNEIASVQNINAETGPNPATGPASVPGPAGMPAPVIPIAGAQPPAWQQGGQPAQPAPPQGAPAVDPAAQNWQQPQAEQPWQGQPAPAPQQAPVQQPAPAPQQAPAAAPQQPAPAQQAPAQAAPVLQQPAPAAQPGMPPWAGGPQG